MISELLNADHGTRNKLLQLTHNGLYPELRPGDYVIWQQVKGFVQEGYYVVDSGGEPNVYLVQNCGGLLRLVCPDRDVEAATKKLKKNANPQEISPEKFAKFCLGFVVASLKVHHTEAFHQREALVARPFVRVQEKAPA